MRVLALLAILSGSARADEPRWYQQFYATLGYRAVTGLEASASSPSFALGYRLELGAWGIDLAAIDMQTSLGVGLHEISRLTGYRVLHRWRRGQLWAGGGAGYSFVHGWTKSDVPERTMRGPELALLAGFDFARQRGLSTFVQLGGAVPIYGARDVYRSMDSSVHVVGIALAGGLRF